MQTMRIEFRRQRDFGDKISATFDFLRINFRSILRSVVLIAGPIILIGIGLGVIFGSRIAENWNTIFNDGFKSEPLVFGSLILGGVLYFLFIYTTIIAVIYSYIQLYLQDTDLINDTQTVFEYTKTNFLNIVKITLGTIFLVLVVYGIFAGILVAVFAGTSGGGAASAGIMILAFMFIFFPILIYGVIALSFVPFICIIEEKGFFASISRSFYLIKNHWWNTFGYILVIGLIQTFMSYIFQIPLLFYSSAFPLVSLGEKDSSFIYTAGYIILFLIYLFGSQILNIFNLTAVAFQYFNIVEIKEGVGLQQRIHKVGEKKKEEEEDF
jgi:hypothetical protein